MTDDHYVYDEASGEWRPASETVAAGRPETRDSAGTLLTDGDSVVLIKDLKVQATETGLNSVESPVH